MSNPGVSSHRVDLPEEERDLPFQGSSGSQDKRNSRQGAAHTSAFPPHYYPPYWAPPYMYMPPHHYGHGGTVTAPEPSSHSPQLGTYLNHPHHQPPQYLAVNVHTDNNQHNSQRASASASSRQVTVKEKIIKNVSRGLEQLLDARVLAAGLATFLLPRVAQHVNAGKRRRRGLFLEFGLA